MRSHGPPGGQRGLSLRSPWAVGISRKRRATATSGPIETRNQMVPKPMVPPSDAGDEDRGLDTPPRGPRWHATAHEGGHQPVPRAWAEAHPEVQAAAEGHEGWARERQQDAEAE